MPLTPPRGPPSTAGTARGVPRPPVHPPADRPVGRAPTAHHGARGARRDPTSTSAHEATNLEAKLEGKTWERPTAHRWDGYTAARAGHDVNAAKATAAVPWPRDPAVSKPGCPS